LGFVCPGLKTHAQLYPSTGFHDELAWAAVWLYKATQDGTFLTAAMSLFNASQIDGNSDCCGYGTFSWDTKSPGAPLKACLLALHAGISAGISSHAHHQGRSVI
jgi:hypothetical protein